MTARPGELGLHPGSRSPVSPPEVEKMLKAVPGIVFLPELEPCLLSPGRLADEPSPEELIRVCDAAWLSDLVARLADVERRADQTANGGLKFLAHTLSHFLTVQKIGAGEHPLVVGIYLRSHARKAGASDDVRSIVEQMDGWDPA